MAMGPMICMGLSHSSLTLQWLREDLGILPEEPFLPPLTMSPTRRPGPETPEAWQAMWISVLDGEIAREEQLERMSQRIEVASAGQGAPITGQLDQAPQRGFARPDLGWAFTRQGRFFGYSRQDLLVLDDAHAGDVQQVKAMVRQRGARMLQLAQRLPVDRQLRRVHLWVFPGPSPWAHPVGPGNVLVSVATITDNGHLEQALRLALGSEPDLRSRLSARLGRLRNDPPPMPDQR